MHLFLIKDLSLNQLIDLEVFEIKNQVVDAINKVVSIQLENNILFFVPSELNIHLPFNNIFNIELNNYKTTNKLLKQYMININYLGNQYLKLMMKKII